MNEQASQTQIRNGRVKLIALLAIFIFPLVTAYVMLNQYQSGTRFEISTHGELISPAVPIEDFKLSAVREQTTIDRAWLEESWTLVYFAGRVCGAVCEQNIYHMRQIHISLGKRSHRLQRLAVVGDVPAMLEFLGDEYPHLIVAEASGPDQLANQVGAAVASMPRLDDAMYLIDPFGNLMMRFSPEADPKGVLSDIKRALKASRIG